MMPEIFKLMDRLAPLQDPKNSSFAAFLGFVLGGIGLGLYLRSFIDFVFPIALAIAALVLWTGLANLDAGIGALAGATIASMWGYFRVENSNRRLTTAAPPTAQDATPPGMTI